MASLLVGSVPVVLSAHVAIGCASNPSTSNPDGAGSSDVSIPEPSAPASAPPAKTQDAVATDHEFTPNDCNEMGRKYHDLHASDLRKVIKPGLSPKQIEEAEDTIGKAANQLSETWVAACMKSNVGTFAPEEALNCAMHATTVNGFDECLNAPPGQRGTAPPPSSAKQSAPPPGTR